MSDHVDVVIIGAGLSGIGAAWRLQEACPWASFLVLEGRDTIGGTWDLFRYPGIRSDSDMFTLGYPFRPWQGEDSIAGGEAIRSYIAETARVGGVDRRIRFGHRVTNLAWDPGQSLWTVTARVTDGNDLDSDKPDSKGPDSKGPESDNEKRFTCRFVFSCTGYYRYDRGHTPSFDGEDDFAGVVVHPQFWPEDLDLTGRRVAVVGSGATAITLVPKLAAVAEHVTMVQRSPTWVVGRSTRSSTATRLRRWLPRRWADRAIRSVNVAVSQGSYFGARRFPGAARRLLTASLERDLPHGFAIDPHFTPHYDPWEQRLCVATDGDLFAAIANGSVTVVTDTVEGYSPGGLRLGSGANIDADVVVTATGLELLFMGGMEITVGGHRIDPAAVLTYEGMMLEGVPNLAVAFGYANASWTLKSDITSRFVAGVLNYLYANGLHDGDLTTCTPVNGGVAPTNDPIMGLSSGYVRRAAGAMPKQGAAAPWRVAHSYRADRKALGREPWRHDPCLVFS